jgi:hypothetical protein
MSRDHEDDGVARAWGGGAVTKVLGAVAALYLVAVWSEAVKSGTSAKWLPAPVAYFTQVAALFPGAARVSLDYRVEGYRCHDKTWSEIDVRPYFPIDADNKENRFYRFFHFYHQADEEMMRALEAFVLHHYNADAVDAAAAGRGGEQVGGVRFVRLKLPIGAPGDGEPRYERKPLDAYPEDVRDRLFATPKAQREERCAAIGR